MTVSILMRADYLGESAGVGVIDCVPVQFAAKGDAANLQNEIGGGEPGRNEDDGPIEDLEAGQHARGETRPQQEAAGDELPAPLGEEGCDGQHRVAEPRFERERLRFQREMERKYRDGSRGGTRTKLGAPLDVDDQALEFKEGNWTVREPI